MDTIAAPAFLDLAWTPAPDGRLVAPRTALFEAALAVASRGMEAAGIVPQGGLVAWDLDRAPGEPVLARRLAAWERVAREEHARREARAAARRPAPTGEVDAVQAGLRELLESSAWAFGSRVDLADRFAQERSLSPAQAAFARDILRDARSLIRSVDARLAEPAGAEELAQSEGEQRRADLLQACRAISAKDEDRARDANSIGWDAPSSASGHRLAGRESLSPHEGAHAYRLVRRHRRQLPADLRDRLGM
ncbi:hypothetical protein D8770_14315 [Methylobacterium sp. DB1607]|nr:hypothetical protein [Methylobacterium sp. DB1607]